MPPGACLVAHDDEPCTCDEYDEYKTSGKCRCQHAKALHAADDDDDDEDEIERELPGQSSGKPRKGKGKEVNYEHLIAKHSKPGSKARTSVAAAKTEALQNFHKSGSGSSSSKKAGQSSVSSAQGVSSKDEVKLGAVFITTCGTIMKDGELTIRDSRNISTVAEDRLQRYGLLQKNAVVRESWSTEAVDRYLRKLFQDAFTYFDLRYPGDKKNYHWVMIGKENKKVSILHAPCNGQSIKTHRGSPGQGSGLTRLRLVSRHRISASVYKDWAAAIAILEEGKELEDSEVEEGTESSHDIAETSKAARSKTRTASKRRRERSASVDSESGRSDRVTRSSAAKQKIKQESEPSTSTEPLTPRPKPKKRKRLPSVTLISDEEEGNEKTPKGPVAGPSNNLFSSTLSNEDDDNYQSFMDNDNDDGSIMVYDPVEEDYEPSSFKPPPVSEDFWA
ncbi:hypothetical protein BDZ89DRAFT_1069528 [Hymenopellis radicata]|nr:hypothetical protein BDZ89DRAFT_1069528 [Hymenopellis radicata]